MESEKRIYTCELCGAEFETPGAKGGHKRAHQIKISEEELLAELRRLANVSEQAPTMKMMDEQGAYSAACIRQRFGTWGDALREIGLSPNIKYDIPSTEVKEDIEQSQQNLDVHRHHQSTVNKGISPLALRKICLEVGMRH